MASFRKRGRAWRVEVCRNGVKRSATLDTCMGGEGRGGACREKKRPDSGPWVICSSATTRNSPTGSSSTTSVDHTIPWDNAPRYSRLLQHHPECQRWWTHTTTCGIGTESEGMIAPALG